MRSGLPPMPLDRPVLAQDPTCPAFGNPEPFADGFDIRPSPRGAQEFPLAASWWMSLSKVRSATILRSWPFSR